MFSSPEDARKKWCPFVRIEGNNRFNNMLTDGFGDANNPHHCIAEKCMAWREVHPQYVKAAVSKLMHGHGYCGLAGKPDFE